jgi:polyhydroxyalkanoate synthesis regulator phasin
METPDFVQDGIDSVDRTVRRLRRDGRKALKQAERERRRLEKDLDRRVRRLTKDASGLRDRVVAQIGKTFDAVLSPLPLATKTDVAKVDRKVKTLSRKLAKVEQAKPRRVRRRVA